MSDTECDKKSEHTENRSLNGKEISVYTDENNHEDEELTLEDLAPDGGWGWMIALALVIVFVTTFSAGSCLSIIFGEFFESTGQSGSAMTLLNAVFMVSYSLSGVMTNALLKKFSIRVVSVGAAILFAIPNILLAFATHIYQMAVISFIQGIGGGLMNTICSANFNAFFVKNRAKVMSSAQVIIGIGGIVYPLFVEKMMAAYGWRGTAALIGAISLNSIAGMMMMQPVEWHLRDPNEVLEERRRLHEKKIKLHENVPPNHNKIAFLTSAKRRSSWHVIRDLTAFNRGHSSESLKCSPHDHELSVIDNIKDKEVIHNGTEHQARPRSKSMRIPLSGTLSLTSASSIGEITTALVKCQQKIGIVIKPLNGSKEKESSELLEKSKRVKVVRAASIIKKEPQESSLWETIENLFEISLLKDRSFMVMSVGISFVFVSDYTFMSLLPLSMLQAGYTNSDAALTITVSATAELASRVLFLIFTIIVNIRPKIIFFFAMITMSIVKFVFYSCGTTLTGILVCAIFIGIVRSFLFVPQPLVVVENYPVEKYAVCYGIFTLVNGVIIVLFGPFVGLIKDLTNSFDISQLVLIAFNSIFIIPWALELIVDYRKKKRKIVKTIP